MKIPFKTCLSLAFISALFAPCCADPQSAASAVITIDHAICDVAEDQKSEPSWEVFVCDVLGDGNVKAAHFTVRVPKEQAPAFAARHAALKIDGGGL